MSLPCGCNAKYVDGELIDGFVSSGRRSMAAKLANFAQGLAFQQACLLETLMPQPSLHVAGKPSVLWRSKTVMCWKHGRARQ